MKTHENVENVRDLVKTDFHLAITMAAEKVNTDQPNKQNLTQNHERKSKHIPYIFKDESTGSCIRLSRHIHVTRIAAMCIIFTRIGCTLLTCDMYMCRERHIHDLVLSSYSVYYHYLTSPHSFLQQATPHIVT
jgi:hypothetical protein